ncbi:hypothetical protein BPOR_0623g00040 [Botrytis porri]|uniref:2EXR domain-containing protein n=1 Tax=Botrytis porri TaxID=87229 RepID=A0A4Z1KDW2_9HELO|nr:hypothetical protein BPOR_0623g00040 [Botrytis porri]
MASSTPSRNRGTKRARKNGAGKGNKVAVVPAPITQPSPQPQPPQPSQDPRYSLTYILNTPTPPIHPSTRTHTLPALPSKIRHLIWTYARSRTILITISNGRIFSRSPSPITFRINQESRSATLHHYSVHPHFYIPGTPYQNQNESEKIHYPFFDPSVDSVVLNQISTDHHPTLPFTSTIFEFYDSNTQQTIFGKRKSVDYTHFDILHSLHIPSRAWDWKRIYRAPRMDIRFRNLTEIVLEGGAMGLKTRRDVKKCKEFIRGCFERSVEEIDGEEEIDDDAERMDASSGIVGNARTAEMENRVPEVRVIMPNGLDHEWMFEEDKLGMESIEERTWRVVDGDGKLLGVERWGTDDAAGIRADSVDIMVVPRGL